MKLSNFTRFVSTERSSASGLIPHVCVSQVQGTGSVAAFHDLQQSDRYLGGRLYYGRAVHVQAAVPRQERDRRNIQDMLRDRDTRQGRLAGRVPIGRGYEFQISKLYAHVVGRLDTECQSRSGHTHGRYATVESRKEANGTAIAQVLRHAVSHRVSSSVDSTVDQQNLSLREQERNSLRTCDFSFFPHLHRVCTRVGAREIKLNTRTMNFHMFSRKPQSARGHRERPSVTHRSLLFPGIRIFKSVIRVSLVAKRSVSCLNESSP